MPPAIIAVVLGMLGCAGGPELELALVHDDALDPSRDFTTADILFVDLGDPAMTGDESISMSWSGQAGDLLEGVSFPDFDLLPEGHTFAAAVVFGARSGCVSADRVAGRSLPFVHSLQGDQVVISVGCVDEIQPTRRPPLSPRLTHGAAPVAEGALVLGGAARLDPSAPTFWRDGVTTVERYDMRTGAFAVVGALDAPRVFPAALALDGGEVAAIGGTSIPDGSCFDTMEVVWPTPRSDLPTLPSPRCRPSAARIENGNVAVHGGQRAGPTLTTLDETLGRVVDDAALPGATRASPQLIPLGTATLSIGGDGYGADPVALLTPGCGAAGAPCSIPIPVEAASDPGPGWVAMTGGVVPCVESGSVTTGAIYVTGGGVRPDPSTDPDTTLDGIFCTPLSTDPSMLQLRRVGALPQPRRDHQTVLVNDGAGEIDLLLVGGQNGSTARDDGTLLQVRGCTCEVVSTRTVPMHGAPPLVFHSATLLVDGTVLVVGGSRLNLADMTVDAVPYAGLYFSDVVLP